MLIDRDRIPILNGEKLSNNDYIEEEDVFEIMEECIPIHLGSDITNENEAQILDRIRSYSF